MSSAKDLGAALGKQMQDKDRIKPQLGKRPKIFPYTRTRTERIGIYELTLEVNTRSIASDILIWGNVDFGTWNSFKWGSTAQTSLVLGNTDGAAVLGTSKLGSQSSAFVNHAKVNPSKTYIERFNNDTFKDATTTADWATTPGSCAFTNAEIAVSEIFAKNSETYTQATLVATGTDLSNLTFQVRFNGSDWETITNNNTLIVANPSALGIEWKATASGNATLTEVKIIYST